MSPDEKVLLERTLKLSEENNKILKKMQRATRYATIWGFIKVAIAIGIPVAIYFSLEPYIKQALQTYTEVLNKI